MRLFIAAELPENMREALAETSAALRASLRGRYVAPELFHVTLAFLGEVESWRVDDAATALERACIDHAPFVARLGELGSFGKRSKAALWQGFDDMGAQGFASLAADVREELAREGLNFDAKAFLPHVTLMRAADLSTGELAAPCLAAGRIDTVALFRSDLSGPHPVYEALHRVALVLPNEPEAR